MLIINIVYEEFVWPIETSQAAYTPLTKCTGSRVKRVQYWRNDPSGAWLVFFLVLDIYRQIIKATEEQQHYQSFIYQIMLVNSTYAIRYSRAL